MNFSEVIILMNLLINYGHTHSNLDTLVNGTRLVSNQFGYVGHEENNDFNSRLTINVG